MPAVAAAGGQAMHPMSPPQRKSNTAVIIVVVVVAVVVVIGGLAAIAIPSFMKYTKKSKSTEARQFVRKMYDGARQYYMDPSYAPDRLQPVEQQFPEPSAGPVPPLGTCCGERCEPDATLWNNEPWISLRFSLDDPHYFHYEYIVDRQARSFTVNAYGDLDCDGTYSTFSMTGVADESGYIGTAPMARFNELE